MGVNADSGVHYVIGRQILAILRAKFRSMEPVTVQNEFAVERPHRTHPVRGHRAGEAGSISRNLRTCESETSDGRNLDLIGIRVGITAVEIGRASWREAGCKTG